MCRFLLTRTGTSTRCACGGRSVHRFRPKSETGYQENDGSTSSRRRGIRRAGPVDGRALAGDQVCPTFFGNRSVPGSSTRPWSATWSKDVSKTDKKHTKGKDQPKGPGKRTSFRTRAPLNREARIAQANGMMKLVCALGKCFKFVLK